MALDKFISQMGYRDDSPFRDEPYLDINTPTGQIDMSQTSIPLMANGRYLPPNSGMHQFEPGTVREEPMHQMPDGSWMPGETHGEYEELELTDEEVEEYRRGGYVVEYQDGGQTYEQSNPSGKTRWPKPKMEGVKTRPIPRPKQNDYEIAKADWESSRGSSKLSYDDLFKQQEYVSDPSGDRQGFYDTMVQDGNDWIPISVPMYNKPSPVKAGEMSISDKHGYRTYTRKKQPIVEKIQPRPIDTTVEPQFKRFPEIPSRPTPTITGYSQSWNPILNKWEQQPQYTVIPEPGMYKQQGGEVQELTDQEIAQMRAQGYIIEEL